jgi:hypothetical protein
MFAGFKVLTEQIKAVSSSLLSGAFYKVLEETVIKIQEMVTTLSAFRSLEERIVAVANVGFGFASSFIERLVVISQLVTQRTKIFAESIVAIPQFIGRLSRLLLETIVINWQKLSQTSITFTQTITVRLASFVYLQTKLLVERIVAATNWIFEKTQFVELTDTIEVVVGFFNSGIKVFRETIRVAGSMIHKVARIFTQSLAVDSWFQGARSYSFTEAIEVVGSFVLGTISKMFNEVVKVRIIFEEGRNLIMSETLAIVDSIRSIASKVFGELVSVVGALASWSIGKVLEQAVAVFDTIRFRKTQFKVLYDSAKVSVQMSRQAGKIFGETIDVISSIGEWVIGKVIVQPVIVIASYLSTWTLSRVYQESIKVISGAYNQAGKIFGEMINVVDTFVLGTISKLFNEIVKVYDVIAKTLPARIYSETVVVVGSVYNQSAKIFSEVISVVDQFILGTISKLFIETVKIVQQFITGGTFYKVLSEVVSVVGTGLNQGGKIFAEAIEAVDTFVLDNLAKMFYETIRVATSFTQSVSRIFSEAFSVVSDATKLFGGRVFSEVVSVVSPTITKLTGRIFNEVVVVGWAKIKLVLNGIQVGLWKKVARVTNGTWRKVSRNEN